MGARFADISRQIAEPLQRAAEAVLQVQAWYRDLADKLGPALREWLRTNEEATAVLVEHGWWPHPHWPITVLREVLRLKQTRRLRSLDKMICDAYEANRRKPMREAVDRWMSLPEFRQRRRIIEDGLWAYAHRRYALALSAWLPHVEGVLRDLTDRRGWRPASWKRTIHEVVDEQTFVRVCLALFEDSTPQGRAFPVRRDPILHGTFLNFGRRAFALRVFLILDALHYFIHEFETTEPQAA